MNIEKICEQIHNAWWEEKAKQGFKHPCMIPYNQLTEKQKELDRVTVYRVLDILKKEGILNGND